VGAHQQPTHGIGKRLGCMLDGVENAGAGMTHVAGLPQWLRLAPVARRCHPELVGEDERSRDDERLLRRAEEALTEIRVATGLSERHVAVLAALRIRLKGDPGKSLEDLLAAAGDLEGPSLDEAIERADAKPSRSIDDLLSKGEKPKRSLDDLLG
jgi:hypothetical protein